MTLEVIEVDQWTSTGNMREIPFDDLKRAGLDVISGGDSEAARQIFGGSFLVKHVRPEDHPRIGSVWFMRGEAGFPEVYRANYDSSD